MNQTFNASEGLGSSPLVAAETLAAAYPQPTAQNQGDLPEDNDSDEANLAWSPDEQSEENGVSLEDPELNGEVILIVRQYMEDHGLEVRFDGDFVHSDALQMAHSAADIERVLARQDKDEDALIDEVAMHVHRTGLKVAVGLIKRAVRIIKREEQQKRVMTVMTPLLAPLLPEEQIQAEEQWRRFVGTVFEMDTSLGDATLKKFIHSVKSKLLNRPVKRHLMPIFQSMVQGSGKTTAALKFLTPLKELRTEPALLSDFADRRSGDVYRYPVVFIDDMDKISPSLIPTLNSLVTGDGLLRRQLGSSSAKKTKQRSTLIGTCNPPIDQVIPDETGNRRFVTMPFRNGEVSKGGDPQVWEVINETDFELLWRSVDVFGADPVEPVLSDLFEWQQRFRRLGPVEDWLINLDVASDEVRAISDKNGARAQELYNLFAAQTNSSVSSTKFGIEMNRLTELSRGPFKLKARDGNGYYFPLRFQS